MLGRKRYGGNVGKDRGRPGLVFVWKQERRRAAVGFGYHPGEDLPARSAGRDS
jgi:hypothetical protein